MSIFRVEKNSNYSIISNCHLKEKCMSLKAKGLLSLMLSLPEDWDYSTEGLVELSDDGDTSVRGALKELENFNYLERKPIKEKGKIVDWQYNIFEVPHVEKPLVENPHVENQGQQNTNKQNTNIYNKENTKRKKKSCNDFTTNTKESYIMELFDKIWVLYPRKTGKEQAKKTWYKKLKCLNSREFILTKARTISKLFVAHRYEWKNQGRELQYIPTFSKWLNDNIPDK